MEIFVQNCCREVEEVECVHFTPVKVCIHTGRFLSLGLRLGLLLYLPNSRHLSSAYYLLYVDQWRETLSLIGPVDVEQRARECILCSFHVNRVQ